MLNSGQVKPRWLQRALLAGAVCLGLLRPDGAVALDPGHDLLQYNCQSWSRPNGLPANGINAITQTTDGYLWLGTSIGLVRFDGIEFKLLDLGRIPEARSSVVNSLASDRNGGLWVGLENSSFGFCDGQSFSFRSPASWAKADPDVQYVHSILESADGALWLDADGAVLKRLPGGHYLEIMGRRANLGGPTNGLNVLCSCENKEGRLWFGTVEEGIYYCQNGAVAKLPDPALDGKDIVCLAEDHNGQLWAGTEYGLYCYDSHTLSRKEIPALPLEIRALLTDSHGVVWIGTTGQGLARYRNGTYAFLRKIDGLASDYVRALAEDQEGSIWIGTRVGLSQLTDVKFNTRPTAEDPSVKDALAVCASRSGGIWVGSAAGLTYFDGRQPKTYGFDSGLENTYIKRVYEASDGDVYAVSGLKNLVIFSGEKVVANYPAPTMVVGLTEDAKSVVASMGGKLFRVGRHSFSPYVFTNREPPMDWILNLAKGLHGEIWVASINGIFRIKDGDYEQWGKNEGLPDPRVQWVCEDEEGTVWGASLNGIVCIKEGSVHLLSRHDGLFDNNIYSIVPDDYGNLWVDSGRGVFTVAQRSVNDFVHGRASQIECVAYDGPESVRPSDKTSQEHVACKSADGRIWFPSANGVVEIDPARVPRNEIAPPVRIDTLRANGLEMFRSNSVVVSPGAGELEIHFSALSFIAPHNVKLRYMLEGYDKNWVEVKDRHVAFYTNLKPGHYRFHVIAANADGVWNRDGDTIEIELQPHYYETMWFDVLCVLAASGIMVGIIAWRIRQLERKEAESRRRRHLLEAEVQSRTAELAKANASLQKEISGHEQTEHELQRRTASLELEIEERQRMQHEVERAQRELLETSRLAGMSEIATNVLHNVGNVLNSVNISASLLTENMRRSKVDNLAKVIALLEEHRDDLGKFLTEDPRGRQLPAFLAKLTEYLRADKSAALQELDSLGKNIEHIKEIVAMQQSYAKVSGVKEFVNLHELIEDSLRMNLDGLERKGIEVVRDFHPVPMVNVEKHKILQILINLLRNAKYACEESGRPDKKLTVRVAQERDRIKISVADNGVGILAENLTRIFNHGFTTRSTGHGFGLHGGALAASEMGGSLTAYSEGPGQGATFTLDLPIAVEEDSAEPPSKPRAGLAEFKPELN